jgi:transposase-like protein
MRDLLNEKKWRQYLALEAQECGSVRQVAQEARVSSNTIRRGMRELQAGDSYTPGARQRENGGGRKEAIEKDAKLLADLESLLEPKGDPMSLLKWTTKSVSHLKAALACYLTNSKERAKRDRQEWHVLAYSLYGNICS